MAHIHAHLGDDFGDGPYHDDHDDCDHGLPPLKAAEKKWDDATKRILNGDLRIDPETGEVRIDPGDREGEDKKAPSSGCRRRVCARGIPELMDPITALMAENAAGDVVEVRVKRAAKAQRGLW